MSKAVALFTGGITDLRQIAVRSDGVCFQRAQFRDSRYGYRWSAWKETGETLGENAISNIQTMECGFATLRRARANDCCLNNRAWFNAKGEIRIRLP